MIPKERRIPILFSVRTQRLLLRPFRCDDAAMFREVVHANADHLGPIYARVLGDDPSIDGVIRRVRFMRRVHLLRQSCAFAVFQADESELIGAAGLLFRIGAGAGEIGYWISKSHAKRGYASEAAAALARIGFELHRLRRAEIHTDPTNLASIGVARRIGFSEQVTFRAGTLAPDGPVRDAVIWALGREGYLQSAAAANGSLEAFDRRNRRVL